MSLRRALASVVLLALVVTPVLALAGDDLSGSGEGSHHSAGLRHQPSRHWRTVPATLDAPPPAPPSVPSTTLDAREPDHRLPVVVRVPFVPPRG